MRTCLANAIPTSSLLGDVTHSHLRHDSFTRETWLIHLWDGLCVSKVLFCVRLPCWCCPQFHHCWGTWPIHTWDMTHSFVGWLVCFKGPFCVRLPCWCCPQRHHCGTWPIHTWDMTMGWLRSVGSLKLQVSLAKEPYKREYILRKRLGLLRSLLIVATPYYICEMG